MIIEEDLKILFDILPNDIGLYLKKHPNRLNLIEIILDIGRKPEARFINTCEYLSEQILSFQDLYLCTKNLENFNIDNRVGIDKTLHRISCLKNKKGNIIGLTFRIGRSLFGKTSKINDLLETNQSILILGKPGVGKTTVIREIARILSDELQKRVIIIDTSNEIAGNSDIPHVTIGRSRRLQVSSSDLQYNMMIEAVENHTPEVIIVDEIGNENEVLAARTIAERGIQLIGTMHANSLENLIKNPVFVDIIGGIQSVVLTDEESKRRGTQKSILERKMAATFQIAIEINQKTKWFIHENIDQSVDLLLQKQNPFIQSRSINEDYKIVIQQKVIEELNNLNEKNESILIENNDHGDFDDLSIPFQQEIKVYFYSICSNKIQNISQLLGCKFILTNDISKANIIFSTKSYVKQNKKICEIAKLLNIPIFVVKKPLVKQLTQTISKIARL
uniref:Ycf45 n=1 Tax=Merotricha bacillata TaxID=658122 RepID=UPI0021151AA6|nr:Ycf45 [Merotricha bacillata]UTE94594.1 Ycf45 [Merotricha bacillata]